ncbi:zinc-binding dehydrogenase, partial [Streptomyces cellulosae]
IRITSTTSVPTSAYDRRMPGPVVAMPDGPALTSIADLIDAGEVSVEVEKTFPLAEAAEAHIHGEAGHTRGKLVLTAAD